MEVEQRSLHEDERSPHPLLSVRQRLRISCPLGKFRLAEQSIHRRSDRAREQPSILIPFRGSIVWEQRLIGIVRVCARAYMDVC